jgi:hypothetical protein
MPLEDDVDFGAGAGTATSEPFRPWTLRSTLTSSTDHTS